MSAISACDFRKVDALAETNSKKESNMETIQSTTTIQYKIPPIDAAALPEIESATFAMGWFWGPDSQFGSMDGVVRTRVGYSGGQKKDPTYRSIGDHSETIQIDYDPTRVSYKELLFIFWQNHDPTSRAWSRQYMSAIFYHNDDQKKLALETRAFEENQRNKKIQTEIVPYSKFYLAEDYHQKYQLRQHSDLMKEFKAMYPRGINFVNSTAAARINGYIAGHGTPEEINATIANLGLSSTGRERLLAISKRWKN